MWKLRVVRERAPETEYGNGTRMGSPAEVWAGFRDHFATLDREIFAVVILDQKHRMIGYHQVSEGCLTVTVVHPREVFKALILSNAAAFIAMHNNPSGDPTPSAEDVQLTKRLRELAELIGIRLLDHIIFGDGKYCSMQEDGYWSTT